MISLEKEEVDGEEPEHRSHRLCSAPTATAAFHAAGSECETCRTWRLQNGAGKTEAVIWLVQTRKKSKHEDSCAGTAGPRTREAGPITCSRRTAAARARLLKWWWCRPEGEEEEEEEEPTALAVLM